MDKITLFRKRLIPNECVPLKNDIILYCDDELIVTKWETIHPRQDMNHGYSAYFINKEIKVSKFCKGDGTLLHWYCDIVEYDIDKTNNRCTTTDLLADVLILPDGSCQVVDLDELSIAHKDGLITTEQLYKSLNTTNRLLNDIYSGKFKEYEEIINKYIQ